MQRLASAPYTAAAERIAVTTKQRYAELHRCCPEIYQEPLSLFSGGIHKVFGVVALPKKLSRAGLHLFRWLAFFSLSFTTRMSKSSRKEGVWTKQALRKRARGCWATCRTSGERSAEGRTSSGARTAPCDRRHTCVTIRRRIHHVVYLSEACVRAGSANDLLEWVCSGLSQLLCHCCHLHGIRARVAVVRTTTRLYVLLHRRACQKQLFPSRCVVRSGFGGRPAPRNECPKRSIPLS